MVTAPIRQTDRHVEAVLAATDILECFLHSPELTIKQLMQKTGQTRNRVMRLAGTLEYRGYLVHDHETRAYGLGPMVMFLGKTFERNQSIVSLVRPYLRRLVRETGESASFYVREGLERVVLAREEGTQAVRYTVMEGQRMELYAGAGGKALLAFAPRDVTMNFLDKDVLPELTSNTITDPQSLAEELDKIRRTGVAVSFSERTQEVGAIAAPVFDYTARIIGAVGLAGPASRMKNLVSKQGTKIIVEAAQELSKAFGWQW